MARSKASGKEDPINKRFGLLLTPLLILLLSISGLAEKGSLPLYQLYYIEGASFGDRLGFSAASAGDVNGDGRADFIIGAPRTAVGGAGAAYVFSGFDGVLLFQIDGPVGSQLGYAVASAGDVNGDGKSDFLIGAPDINSSAGATYIRSGADGSLLFELNGSAGSRFGYSVAPAGDINADGTPDFIIGAPRFNSGAGAVFVYSGINGELLYEKFGTSGDEYGNSVAPAGDVNGDGRADFIIGAHAAGLLLRGAAYVFSGTDGSLLFEKNGTIRREEFGYSVASAGDVNGDGRADFIVGAPHTYTQWPDTMNPGSACVYSGADGTLLFKKTGFRNGDGVGISVASAGDLNGDGRSDFLVGAWGYDYAKFSDAGAVFVYSGADGSVLFSKYGSNSTDNLGYSVASAGDVSGDGKPDILFGTWLTSNSERYGLAGSVFVYGAVPTDVAEERGNRPGRFELFQNYPNPFNATTAIRYRLPQRGKISLAIFNILGQPIRVLLDGQQTAGEHLVTWDGKDEKGKILPSGIYFYRLRGKDIFETKKMLLLK